MIWIIALIGLCFLALWTVFAWITHQGWNAIAGLSWEESLPKLRELPIPEWLLPGWKEHIEDFAPLIQWVAGVFNEALGWLGAGVPVLIWVIWAVGALLLLLLFGGGMAFAAWLKSTKLRTTPSGVVI
jgi:hypothetical protein